MEFENLFLEITISNICKNKYINKLKQYNINKDIIDETYDLTDNINVMHLIIYNNICDDKNINDKNINDKNIIFSKIILPNCSYISEPSIIEFIKNDTPFIFYDSKDGNVDIMTFNKNYLIFKHSISGYDIDTFQHIIFKLSNNQLTQFKKEFNKLLLLNNYNNINIEDNIEDNITSILKC